MLTPTEMEYRPSRKPAGMETNTNTTNEIQTCLVQSDTDQDKFTANQTQKYERAKPFFKSNI